MDPNEDIPKYKVIMMGDAGVGKTSLAIQYAQGTFDFRMSPTVGSSHIKARTTIEDRQIELMIWDTAGHERFNSLIPIYSRGAHACVIVASVVNNDSCTHIVKWISIIKETEPDCPLLLALNKIDLVEDTLPNLSYLRDSYASGIEDVFYTSARSGDGVDHLFHAVAAAAISHCSKVEDDHVDISTIEKDHSGCPC